MRREAAAGSLALESLTLLEGPGRVGRGPSEAAPRPDGRADSAPKDPNCPNLPPSSSDGRSPKPRPALAREPANGPENTGRTGERRSDGGGGECKGSARLASWKSAGSVKRNKGVGEGQQSQGRTQTRDKDRAASSGRQGGSGEVGACGRAGVRTIEEIIQGPVKETAHCCRECGY